MKIKRIGFLATLVFTTMMINAQQFVGDWKGAISVQGVELELVFHITEEGGTYATTLDVPMQGAAGIPVEKTEVDGNTLTLDMAALQATYEGTLNAESIEGTFKQMGQEFPLTLNKFESKLPGNPDLVSSDEDLQKLVSYDTGNYKYKVEDYFSRPKASSFQLSPDGKYMSYTEKEDGSTKNHVYVKEISTGEVTRVLEEKDELIRGYFWKNNERILYVMNGAEMSSTIFTRSISTGQTTWI